MQRFLTAVKVEDVYRPFVVLTMGPTSADGVCRDVNRNHAGGMGRFVAFCEGEQDAYQICMPLVTESDFAR
jgi:hypothetical protein